MPPAGHALAACSPGQVKPLTLSSRFQLDPSVNLQQIVERCPAHTSGADLYALCSDAMMAAIKRKTVSVEMGENRAQRRGLCVTVGSRRCVALMQVWTPKTRRCVSVPTTLQQLWKRSGRPSQPRSCRGTDSFSRTWQAVTMATRAAPLYEGMAETRDPVAAASLSG